jgi:hypothetical protein
MNDYICSECKAQVSSEGTEARDHLIAEHGMDPEVTEPQEGLPYFIPLDSNPEAFLER